MNLDRSLLALKGLLCTTPVKFGEIAGDLGEMKGVIREDAIISVNTMSKIVALDLMAEHDYDTLQTLALGFNWGILATEIMKSKN